MPKLMEKERTQTKEETVQNAAHSFARRLKEHPAEALVEGAMGVTVRVIHRTGLTPDDTIWSVVGSAHSTGPNDVSEQKHTYLAHEHTAPKQ
ncbi:MAG: hypothetical protein ACR2MQ_00770 [Gemmatimonadaceae bacterium]